MGIVLGVALITKQFNIRTVQLIMSVQIVSLELGIKEMNLWDGFCLLWEYQYVYM